MLATGKDSKDVDLARSNVVKQSNGQRTQLGFFCLFSVVVSCAYFAFIHSLLKTSLHLITDGLEVASIFGSGCSDKAIRMHLHQQVRPLGEHQLSLRAASKDPGDVDLTSLDKRYGQSQRKKLSFLCCVLTSRCYFSSYSLFGISLLI